MSELRDEVSTPEVSSSELAYRGAVWDIRRETFSLPEAGPLTRDLMAHPGAVGVAVVDRDERILLIRQYRHPARARLWEVPAGLLDVPGEDPLLAAQRELAEEADLEADVWELLADSFQSPGGSSESIRLYLARGLRAVPDEHRHTRSEEEAGFEFRWTDLAEARAAIGAGLLSNAIAQLAIMLTSEVLRAEAAGLPRVTRVADAPRHLPHRHRNAAPEDTAARPAAAGAAERTAESSTGS